MKTIELVVTFTWFSTLVFSVGCASVPPPTLSPVLTYTPAPAYTPLSTYTPYPKITPLSTQAPTQTPAPSRIPTDTPSKIYSSAFGIDYAHPEKYLAQGGQSRISNPAVFSALKRTGQSITLPGDLFRLGDIYGWIKSGFTTWSAGGKTIGAITTDQLLNDRRLGGCHDWGLVYASIARELGYPAVMVDTLSITWAKQFQAGAKVAYVGHVFVEVFIAGKWVLVDSTNNWYVENDYDPTNPVIPLRGRIAGSNEENAGFYVMRKSVDTWGYGIRNNAELTRLMEETARPLKLETVQYPPYNFQRFK